MISLRIVFNITLMLFLLNPSRSQSTIKIIDSDWIINNMNLGLTVDSLYSEIEDSLHQIGMNYVQYFQSKQSEMIRIVGCSGPKTLKKAEDELRREYSKIIKFEEDVIDTLSQIKNQLKDELGKLIHHEVVNFAKEQKIGIVVESKGLNYYLEEQDISREILNRLNSKDLEFEFVWQQKLENIRQNNLIPEIILRE